MVIKFIVFLVILGLVMLWFLISFEGKKEDKTGSLSINIYRKRFKWGEITKKKSKSRGRLIELTQENVSAFAIEHDESDIFWSALKVDSPTNDLSNDQKWGDLYFFFPAQLEDNHSEYGNQFSAGVLNSARKTVRIMIEEYKFPKWAFRYFFTGDGFYILISASGLGVKPRKDLEKVYNWIRDYMARTHNIKHISKEVYKNRALLRAPNTINSSVSSRVPRYVIEINDEEFHGLSLREIDLLSRRPRGSDGSDLFDNKISNQAHMYYIEWLENYEEETAQNGDPPLQMRPCVKSLLTEGITPDITDKELTGYLNDISQEYRRLNYQSDFISEILEDWIKKYVPNHDISSIDTF